MNELQVFQNEQFGTVRTLEDDGKIYFCGRDAAGALGYAEPHKAIARHCKGGTKRPIPTEGGQQELLFITEGDLYRLITHSRLPAAEAFEKWVFDEVLPSIRKTGTYSTQETELTAIAETIQRMAGLMETTIAQFETMNDRIKALEQYAADPQYMELAPARGCKPFVIPDKVARRRWMRTMNEKLDLLEVRFNATRNMLLSKIYEFLEEHFDVLLDEERIHCIERYDLQDCSILEAIYRNEEYRKWFERTVDTNLSPENRGWN